MNIDNQRQILGVGPEAGDEEIRVAYLRKVKEYPPDQWPKEFEQVREAYEALRDPRRRTRHILDAAVDEPLTSLLKDCQPERRFIGPAPWLAVLTKKKA
ncbi:MAG: molecular chaperone DnaJ [Candidatus Angelobacter sp. Gp1-AA117]|nr:MAG: molecular chaperone DnaJ [Candidatus Angelobacter sp. Gp1-AA117]